MCQPLTRISNHHHFQGENPAEEHGSLKVVLEYNDVDHDDDDDDDDDVMR